MGDNGGDEEEGGVECEHTRGLLEMGDNDGDEEEGVERAYRVLTRGLLSTRMRTCHQDVLAQSHSAAAYPHGRGEQTRRKTIPFEDATAAHSYNGDVPLVLPPLRQEVERGVPMSDASVAKQRGLLYRAAREQRALKSGELQRASTVPDVPLRVLLGRDGEAQEEEEKEEDEEEDEDEEEEEEGRDEEDEDGDKDEGGKIRQQGAKRRRGNWRHKTANKTKEAEERRKERQKNAAAREAEREALTDEQGYLAGLAEQQQPENDSGDGGDGEQYKGMAGYLLWRVQKHGEVYFPGLDREKGANPVQRMEPAHQKRQRCMSSGGGQKHTLRAPRGNSKGMLKYKGKERPKRKSKRKGKNQREKERKKEKGGEIVDAGLEKTELD